MLAMLQILINFGDFPSNLIFYYFILFHDFFQFTEDQMAQIWGTTTPRFLQV